MNTQKLYSAAIGRIPTAEKLSLDVLTPDGISPTEEQLSKQDFFNWLEHSATIKMFKTMSEEAQDLIDQATDMALTYHQHNNHINIVSLLIRANTIKKQISKYATINTTK